VPAAGIRDAHLESEIPQSGSEPQTDREPWFGPVTDVFEVGIGLRETYMSRVIIGCNLDNSAALVIQRKIYALGACA
jgi:hypothetical protein